MCVAHLFLVQQIFQCRGLYLYSQKLQDLKYNFPMQRNMCLLSRKYGRIFAKSPTLSTFSFRFFSSPTPPPHNHRHCHVWRWSAGGVPRAVVACPCGRARPTGGGARAVSGARRGQATVSTRRGGTADAWGTRPVVTRRCGGHTSSGRRALRV